MSEIKVNKISPRTNCGTTTLGDSGDTFNLPSGATLTVASGATITNNGTQTGFGREGSVNWQTGSIKTGNFTAVSGEGYFVDTSSGAVIANLPAGSAGAIVSFSDYTRTFQTNSLKVNPNGSEKIGGIAQDAILQVEGQSATFVYVDGTEGWINVQETSNSQTGVLPYVIASGGNTEITSGDFKTHIFTSPGTFTVTCEGAPSGSNGVEYLVVAGGAGGGNGCAGGSGGAGGMRLRTVCGSASPLNAPAPLQVTTQAYTVTVGGGGAGAPPSSPGGSSQRGTDGTVSTFSTITSAGGGSGGAGNPSSPQGNSGNTGGSGGGGGHSNGPGGAGNTPPVSPPQGNSGSPGNPNGDDKGGAGGGAGAAGSPTNPVANGGAGSYIPTTFIGPTAPSYGETGPEGRFFAGGGGGNRRSPSAPPAGVGGLGGGGDGGLGPVNGSNGSTNMGGGASGGSSNSPYVTGGTGGPGIVMIRYKFQN